MTVTIPRGVPPEVEGGYGHLDHPRRRRRLPAIGWIAIVTVLVAAAVIWWSTAGSDDTPAPATTTSALSTTEPTAASASTTASSTSEASAAVPPAGWAIGGELVPYVTDPVYYPAGSTEGDVEVGFVNSVIATARANANPSAEEPELAYWQTGFSLKATRDSQKILAEDGQVIVSGPLTRVEVEKVTVVGDGEADIEYCALLHDFNIVVANPTDRVESLGTLHAVERLVRADDGHWQSSERIQTIQNVDGIGSCLDVKIEPGAGQGG